METRLNPRWFVKDIHRFDVENGRVTLEYKDLNDNTGVIFTSNDVYVGVNE